MSEQTVLTCVYCGHEYPSGTPSWGSHLLTEHIKTCEKHPMYLMELKHLRVKEDLAEVIEQLRNQCKFITPNVLVLQIALSTLQNIQSYL